MREALSLELADGQKWNIIAVESAKDFLGKMASVLHLKRCEKEAGLNLIIVRNGGRADAPEINPTFPCESLPKTGWSQQDFIEVRCWRHHDVADIICDIGDEDSPEIEFSKMRFLLFLIYQQVQHNGGLPLHAALVERNGRGVVISAPGGTGKSTCCLRIPPPWRALCDDETVIVKGKGAEFITHPFPTWSRFLSGRSTTTWEVQKQIPLAAIFFLEQSAVDEVVPLGDGEAAALLTKAIAEFWTYLWIAHYGEERIPFRARVFENACELAKTIPAYRLKASLDGRFWEKMEEVLGGSGLAEVV
ncbi:MAG: SynChlorMet cassette protein ScmC [Deltaproteobacteria bacterium]|nr:SynChlorMet cassette protein ScmC [Deltaproteobacteria bacterium]